MDDSNVGLIFVAGNFWNEGIWMYSFKNIYDIRVGPTVLEIFLENLAFALSIKKSRSFVKCLKKGVRLDIKGPIWSQKRHVQTH